MEKIIAVVVSYNRHPLLVQCIESLRLQTRRLDAILVVNNGSTDFTTVWLDQQDDVIHLYQDNAGSAGGYHAGMKWACDHGYNLIWCMDDDGYPAANALEVLLAHRGHQTELLNSAVLNKNDKKTFVSKIKNYRTIEQVSYPVIEGVCHPFNGTLVHRSIIEKAGLPLSNLFYWGEEREYYYRIANKYRIPVKTITGSHFYHPDLSHINRKEWDCAGSWKMYYFIRNRYKVLGSKHRFRASAIAAYLFFFIRQIPMVLLFQRENKLKKLLFLLWPFTDALRNNFNHQPFEIANQMKAQSKSSILSIVYKPVKKSILNLFVPSYSDGSTAALMEL